MGFDECENPVIVEESDIYRQFGPEAMAVLDRVFYIGGLPRPNVGIARAQIDAINEILKKTIPAATEEKLRETLHAYKKSEIDGDESDTPSWQTSSTPMMGTWFISLTQYSRSSRPWCPNPRAAHFAAI